MKVLNKILRITTRITTGINLFTNLIGWLLAFLTLLFNILGLWQLWLLSAFTWFFSQIIVLYTLFFGIMFSFFTDTWKRRIPHLILNIIFLIISIIVAIFTVFVSCTWFW